MKKTSSREYDPMKESQIPETIKLNKSKNPMLKNFNQKADLNIEKSKSVVEYSEIPMEDVKPGEHKSPRENLCDKKEVNKEDKKNADHAMKFKKAVQNFKQLTSQLGIESLIVKSLEDVNCEEITEEQYEVFSKAINDMDEEGFALFVGMVKSKKTEKGMSSAMGSGGDLIAPQMAGGKKIEKKLVKIKKGINKTFFVNPNQ